MNLESTESSAPEKRRGGRPRRHFPEACRTEILTVRITPQLHEVLHATAKRLSIDASTLAFNILRHTTSKKTLTDEEYLEFSRPTSAVQGFVLWPRGA